MPRSVTTAQTRTDMSSPIEQTVNSRNIGQAERVVSAIGGTALLAYGLRRFDWSGAVLGLLGGGLLYRGLTGHSFAYQGFNINTARRRQGETVTDLPGKKGFRVQRSLTIKRSPEDLYDFWSDLEKMPSYIQNVDSVVKTGDLSAQCVAKKASGQRVEWTMEILEDLPGKGRGWRTQGNPATANAGTVRFNAAPDGRGSVVTLTLDYYTPEGPIWSNISKRFSIVDDHETLETLRRFKEVMEAGEISTTKGQPTGNGRK